MTEILYDDGSKYVGDVVDGKRHGQGYLTFSTDVLALIQEWDTKGDADFSDHWADPRGISTPANTGDTDNTDSTLLAEYNKQSSTWAENYAYIGAWENDRYHGIGTRCWLDDNFSGTADEWRLYTDIPVESDPGILYRSISWVGRRKPVLFYIGPDSTVTKHIGTFDKGIGSGFGRRFYIKLNPKYAVCITHDLCGPVCSSPTVKASSFGVFQNDNGNGLGYIHQRNFIMSGTWENATWSDTENTLVTWTRKSSWGATASWSGILVDKWSDRGGRYNRKGIFPNFMTINFSDGAKFEGEYNVDTDKGTGTITMPNGYCTNGSVRVSETGGHHNACGTRGGRVVGQIFRDLRILVKLDLPI